MKAYITTANGVHNLVYSQAVTNFYVMSLTGYGSKATEFASANQENCISMRHLQRLAATKKRPPPFIQHTSEGVVELVTSQINTIRSKFGNNTLVKASNAQTLLLISFYSHLYYWCSWRIACSVGIDATKLVECWQFSTILTVLLLVVLILTILSHLRARVRMK